MKLTPQQFASQLRQLLAERGRIYEELRMNTLAMQKLGR